VESKLFKETLREATYGWDLDPTDRSWFISQSGMIEADVSHRVILKRVHADEWQKLKKAGEADSDIEQTLENRLIRTGVVKMGELDEFYAIVNKLDQRSKDIIQGFAKSIVSANSEAKLRTISITQLIVGADVIKCTIGDVINDYLYSL
jgi:hypothetical protein